MTHNVFQARFLINSNSAGVGKEVTLLASTQRKIFLLDNAIIFGVKLSIFHKNNILINVLAKHSKVETGINDYCCSLRMKIFEPASLTEFRDYYDMASCKQ